MLVFFYLLRYIQYNNAKINVKYICYKQKIETV